MHVCVCLYVSSCAGAAAKGCVGLADMLATLAADVSCLLTLAGALSTQSPFGGPGGPWLPTGTVFSLLWPSHFSHPGSGAWGTGEALALLHLWSHECHSKVLEEQAAFVEFALHPVWLNSHPQDKRIECRHIQDV